MKKLVIFSLFVMLVLGSCTKPPFYTKVYNFENNAWNSKKELNFDVQIEDTTKSYDITFFIRVSSDYDYNNAWITLHSTLPNKRSYKESHQFFISDDKGNWLAQKSGSLMESEMVFKDRKFPQKGKYRFTIKQTTTIDKLTNVNSIGMRLTESSHAKESHP